jgi:nitrogen fixation protein
MKFTGVRHLLVLLLAFVALSLPALAATPTITSISPNSGPENISPYPVIKGTNFEPGVQVYVNGTVARGAWLSGSTYISFEPPLSAVTGPVPVEVVNPDGGTVTLANGWSYTTASLVSTPTITSVSPNSGPENISPYPVIKGTNFASGVKVYVNGTVARGAWLGGSTYISFEPPLSAVLGPVNVTVINPDGGTATLANGWSYTTASLAPTPTITNISPNSGPDTISPYPTMRGTNFESGMQVYVNGIAARGVWLSGTTIAVFEPPLSSVTGPVSVQVVNPDGGTATLANGFDYTSASLAPGGGSATTTGDTFPRLAYLAIGGSQAFDSTYQANAAKVPIDIIGGDWEGWGSSLSYNKETVIQNIKAQSTVHTRVFQYVDLNELYFTQSSNGFPTYWNEVNTMNWWVYNSGTSGTKTIDAEDSTGTKGVVNMATYTVDPSTDLGPYAWGAKYVNDLLHLGTYSGKGAPVPDLDGFFLDNLAPQPYEDGDWLHTGSSQPKGDPTVGTAFRTGEKTFFDEMSAIWPAGVQLANMGLNSTAWDTGVDFAPLKGAMSGGMDEAAIGVNWSYESWSGAATMQYVYKYTWDNTGGPQYLLFGHSHLQANGVDASAYDSSGNITAYSSTWQGMRHGLAACLMGNGYYTPTGTSGYSDNTFLWFDEFDNAGAGVGYLGQAIDPWQTGPWSNGVWKREYQNGIVLWNPKGNGTQAVSLSGLGNLKHIAGSQDSTVNNGASVTNGTVTLNDRDGLILLRY